MTDTDPQPDDEPLDTTEQVDDRIPHPTHIGLNIAKAIPEDRPTTDTQGRLEPHPDPEKIAAPVLEVLPPDSPLPSSGYLDQIAAEAGDTLAGVWDTPSDATIEWIRDALRAGLDGH